MNTKTDTTTVKGPHTGDALTIYWHEGAGCWTYRDPRGFGPSLGYLSHRHTTRDRAVAAALDADWLRAARGGPLSRADYEAKARRLGVDARTDDECHGYKHFDLSCGLYGEDLSWQEADVRSPQHGPGRKVIG